MFHMTQEYRAVPPRDDPGMTEPRPDRDTLIKDQLLPALPPHSTSRKLFALPYLSSSGRYRTVHGPASAAPFATYLASPCLGVSEHSNAVRSSASALLNATLASQSLTCLSNSSPFGSELYRALAAHGCDLPKLYYSWTCLGNGPPVVARHCLYDAVAATHIGTLAHSALALPHGILLFKTMPFPREA